MWDKQPTAVRGSAFVQLSIIMKNAPCVKWIVCAVLPIKGWTGCLKSPAQLFMSSGMIVASPHCLDLCSATSSACRSAWIGYCAVWPANMHRFFVVFFSGCRWERISCPVVLGVLLFRTGGSSSDRWSDLVCRVRMLFPLRVYHVTMPQDE